MPRKRRRGKGEGTITQRPDGRWMGQITVGYDPVTGKQVRRTVYGETQKEVQEKLLFFAGGAKIGLIWRLWQVSLGFLQCSSVQYRSVHPL